MNLKEKIKNYTTYIVDDRDNKWEVIELSDLQDLLDTDRAEQLILHGVVGQSEQLKCVGCGNDESKDILPQLCNECFKKGCKAF
jgi:hypothetical protein